MKKIRQTLKALISVMDGQIRLVFEIDEEVSTAKMVNCCSGTVKLWMHE